MRVFLLRLTLFKLKIRNELDFNKLSIPSSEYHVSDNAFGSGQVLQRATSPTSELERHGTDYTSMGWTLLFNGQACLQAGGRIST